MKYMPCLLFFLLLSSASFFAQTTECEWKEKGERLAEKAERIAESAARQAERAAAKWQVSAERYAEAAERQWNRKWKPRIQRFPGKTVESSPEGVFLGIEASGISDEKAKKLGFPNAFGSYVTKVIDGSAAQEAGLLPFDYIYGVNEQRTSDNQDLVDIIEDYEPGETVTLHFYRQGKPQTASVKLKSYEDKDWEWNQNDESERAFLGVSPTAEEDGDEMNGVEVEIVDNSTAAAMGLKDGDIIKGINGYPVLDWEDVEIAVDNMKPGEEVEVVFARNGQEQTAKQTIKSYKEVFPSDENLGSGAGNWDWEWDSNWDDQDEEAAERAFLGVFIERVSEEKAKKLGFDNPYGSYITGVLKNTGAEKAGLKPFDYIFGIDEYRVGENQSLGGILTKYKPGDKATIHYIRKGKKSTADLTFGMQADAKKESRNSCQDPFFGVNQSFSVDEGDKDGVKISPVKNSTAEEMGLQSGDVITTINGYPMVDWTDITTAINMLSPGETISVEYLRDGKNQKASKAIKSYAETKKCEDCNCGDRDVSVTEVIEWPSGMGLPRQKQEPAKPRMDVANASYSLENIAENEVSSLKSKGVEISSGSDLTLDRLSLSSNTTLGMFELKFTVPSSGNTVVKVFNASGRTIYEYDLGKFSGEFSDYVDLAQNGSGNYFLQVKQDSKVFTKKIVLSNK